MLASFFYQPGKPLTSGLSRAEMLQALADKDGLLWVDLENPDEFDSDSLVEIFNFHPLAVEDCTSEKSEPKVDDYGEYLFIVMHALVRRQLEERHELATVELHMFLGKNYVVTFHKEKIRSVDQVRGLIERKTDLMMGHGADLLAHSLLDRLVDHFMPIVDRYDHKIDDLEEEIFNNNPSTEYLEELLQLKRDISTLRRMVGPQRDTIYFLTRSASPFINPRHQMYFRDVYDHLLRIYAIAEGFHDSLTGLLQAYYSFSSHRLNDIMRRMTVVATLTMPAVIIASVYGMNFHHMPELDWKYGYLFSIGLMALVSAAMLVWMKIKKWI